MTTQRRSHRVGLVGDRYGQALKQQVLDLAEENQLPFSVWDLGTFSKESDFAQAVNSIAKPLATGEIDCGVFVGASTQGFSILANKVPGIRAVLVNSPFEAEMARRHFDANLLCLGEFTRDVQRTLSAWLTTPFQNQSGNCLSPHARRVAKITALEESLYRASEVRSDQDSPNCGNQLIILAAQ